MAIVYVDGDNPLAEKLAKDIAEDLFAAYPNHSWWVEVRQGLIIIKHFMLSGMRGVIGMVRHLKDTDGDAAARKRDVLRGAGELLERANMARGAYQGGMPTRMELEPGMQKYWVAPVPITIIHEDDGKYGPH